MRQAVEERGAAGVGCFIQQFDDPLERRILYLFARHGLVMDTWQGKNLDAIIGVGHAGMRELLEQARVETDPETRRQRVDAANVIAYNLAADLADCWPGDEVPRSRAHFEAGLGAAGGAARYQEAIAAFGAQLDDAERQDDARSGIDQLETVKSRHLDRQP